jgi:pyridoxal phosphate enzyme (YggS family)
MSPIAANLQAVRRRISGALRGQDREVRLVAVTKQRPPAAILEALEAGCRDIGESYVQEALPKIAALEDAHVIWHYIGHLQGNKARDVAAAFDWVHGVDRAKVAAALDRARPQGMPPLDVCVQVNISGETTKGGVTPGEALQLCREVAALPRLRLRGLMGMASPTTEAAEQRAQFARLRGVYDEARAAGLALDTLSMGMSDDFEAAIAEGSTMVRIGTAIFGERSKAPSASADEACPGELEARGRGEGARP